MVQFSQRPSDSAVIICSRSHMKAYASSWYYSENVKQILSSDVFVFRVLLQVKVWFQNRRTKQKKDQGKDSELRSVVSETAATCSVLRLLEQGRLLTPPGLPGLLPHCGGGTLGTALRPPSMAMSNNGSVSSSSGSTAGGSPPLPAVTSSGTVAGLQSSPAAHSLFSFPMPSILSGVATRISSNPLSMAGSLAGNLQELSARYLSSSAFEPYSRTNGKESMDKKVLEWSCFFLKFLVLIPVASGCVFVVFFVVTVFVWFLPSVCHRLVSRSVTAYMFLHIWRLEQGRKQRPSPASLTHTRWWMDFAQNVATGLLQQRIRKTAVLRAGLSDFVLKKKTSMRSSSTAAKKAKKLHRCRSFTVYSSGVSAWWQEF